MNEVNLSATGVYNDATGLIELVDAVDSYPEELKVLIAKKDSILRERNKILKGDIVTNYNSLTKTVETIDKTDKSKVVKLGKKETKTKKIDKKKKNAI